MERRLRIGSALVSALLFGALPALAQDPPAAPPAQPAPPAPRINRPQRAIGQPQPPQVPDRDPPGAAPKPPDTMDRIAQATDVQYKPKPGAHRVKFNLQDADLAELVNHIAGMTGKRFIYGAKVRQVKATVVSPEPVTLDEAYQAFLSILEANGMTVVPHGRFLKIVDSAGIVQAPTEVYARAQPVPAADRYVTRLYRTKNVSADEAAQLLTKFKSKEADISVYPPGQLLIITDTGTQVNRLIRIIEEVDVGGADDQQMWIQPVHHGTAADMAKRLNELFDTGAGGQPGAPGGAAAAMGLSRVIPDETTNSLIVVGSEDSYVKLIELLKRLDAQPTETGRIRVLPLQHAVAEELANVLNQLLSGQQPRGQAGQPGTVVAGMFEGEIRVTPDKATNSLIITSSGRDYASLRLVIDRLDMARRQVFIEAVIMDLAVSDATTLGVAFHGGALADLGIGGGDSLILGGFDAHRSLVFPGDMTALQGLAAGIRGPDLPPIAGLPGLSIPAFGIALQAIASSGKSNILATPHIIATDNVQAEINIGENIPLQTNVGGGLGNLGALLGQQAGGANLAALGAIGGLGTTPRQDVGNRIKVTPHINESNQVRLEIEQESSAAGEAVGDLGAFRIAKRTATTTVVVQDQQTVVIGGLMRDSYEQTRSKIPILGDLPVLGFLFRRQTVTKTKANLLLVLTPYVIRSQEDLRKIFERKMQERQEFLDRYFVFAGDDWEPPKDYTRTNGLVENIRQSYFAMAEQARLEAESQPDSGREHVPGEPIELPQTIRATGGPIVRGAPAAAPAPAAQPQAPTPRRRRRPAQAQPAPAPPAPAPPAPAQPAPGRVE